MKLFRHGLILLAAALLPATLSPGLSLAYYAPCQNVTGPSVSTNPSGEKVVTFSVHNQADGRTYSKSVNLGTGMTVDSLTTSQGLAAWRVKRDADNNFMIYYATYDPAPGRGWMVTHTDWIIHPTDLVCVYQGVVWWRAYWTLHDPVMAWQYYLENCSTYDPARGQWASQNWTLANLFESFYNVKARICKDGVVAFLNGPPTGPCSLYYALYDPVAGAWMPENEGIPDGTTVSIAYQSLVLTAAGGLTSPRAYDYLTQTWSDDNLYTTPAPVFAALPSSGAAPLTVWFTDMSLGADYAAAENKWIYNWGDGTDPTYLRSTFHRYAAPGTFTCSHSYLPADLIREVTIRTFAPGSETVNLLLLDD